MMRKPVRIIKQESTIKAVWLLIAWVSFVFLSAVPVWSEDHGQESAEHLSKLALQACHEGRSTTNRADQVAYFQRAQRLAERAVQLNDQVADAHFALFCALGEQMRVDGELLTSVWEFNRMMEALDRALALDPHHLDALSSKGTLLVKLPWLLGGDPERGEKMLRQVLQTDRTAINARLVLAEQCLSRGEKKEALTLAKEALRYALQKHRQDLIPEARRTLNDIQSRLR
ncbi:MAG: hypothetical protein D6690_15970 [Nitrospirae bacterium]|nr:MAG: hypothetical protein D6690_15970 [Nitrospirota bacterium]